MEQCWLFLLYFKNLDYICTSHCSDLQLKSKTFRRSHKNVFFDFMVKNIFLNMIYKAEPQKEKTDKIDNIKIKTSTVRHGFKTLRRQEEICKCIEPMED